MSFSDSKSRQVSRILLIILADLYNDLVWIVSTCSFNYKLNNYYHLFSFESFSTPALVEGFSLESEWQQVSSSL